MILCHGDVKSSSSSEDSMAVDSLLQKLGLTDYVDRFHAEQIDRDALVCLTFSLFVSSLLLCHCVSTFLYATFLLLLLSVSQIATAL